jgi:hypothetical protein
MTTTDYWEECLANSCEENEVALTPEQLSAIATDIRRGHENYGMAFGQPESPYPREIRQLEESLQREREKRTCPACKGTGEIVTQGPHHGSWSQCDRCRGQGRC